METQTSNQNLIRDDSSEQQKQQEKKHHEEPIVSVKPLMQTRSTSSQKESKKLEESGQEEDEEEEVEEDYFEVVQSKQHQDKESSSSKLQRVKSSNKKSTKSTSDPKGEWTKYFAYMNDKDREKLMQMPELPRKKSSKIRRYIKQTRLVASSDIKAKTETKTTTTKSNIAKNKSSMNEDEGGEEEEGQSESENKVAAEISSFLSKTAAQKKTLSFNEETRSKPELANKTRSKLDLGKRLNYAEYSRSNGGVEAALGSSSYNSTYKNLVRSLRANL